MIDEENQIKNCPEDLKECKCSEIKTKMDETAKQVKLLQKSFKDIESKITKQKDLCNLNTDKDPQYVAACKRGQRSKILEKRWEKYNWAEQFILMVLGIIFLNVMKLKNEHPVLMEDHWSFYFFKKP